MDVIKDIELVDTNYGQEGQYFLTVCTQNTHTPLSTIVNNKVVLTKAGKIVENFLFEIKKHFSGVKIETHVVMPDHIQAIITINASMSKERFVIHDVSRFEIFFGLMVGRKNPFLIKGSIYHIMTWFKAASLLEIKKEVSDEFAWKSGFFDFTIHNKKSSKAIQKYLHNFPKYPKVMTDPETYFKDNIFPLISS